MYIDFLKLNFKKKSNNLSSMSCNVCIMPFNKSTRVMVKCKCDFEACRICIKTYLLDKYDDAHCMSCKVEWDRTFMNKSFDKKFMLTTYKQHRENILIDREMSMLQATQPYVEREIKLEKLKESMIKLRDDFYRELNKLETDYNGLYNDTNKVERKKFVRKCPKGDCHGFLSSSLKCELCEYFACSHCHETTGKTNAERESHVCNPEIVESVKFLQKDSKPCPKCASMTFKIIGCSQMFCVECHTPWDWITGKIVTGNIHNPHYTEYLTRINNGQTPRNPNDIICGREIDNHFIQRLIRLNQRDFIEISRNIIHIRQVELDRFESNRLQDNMNLRIAYMRNHLNKEDFKKSIQKKEKNNQKNRELSNILHMYINCMTDILYRLVDNVNNNMIIDEIHGLRVYTNKCLESVGKSFNTKIYKIDEKFVFC